MADSQYIALDVASILDNVPVNQRGQVLASSIENTTWYNLQDPRINATAMERIVNKLKRANRRSFPQVMDELKNYADDHNIWINEK